MGSSRDVPLLLAVDLQKRRDIVSQSNDEFTSYLDASVPEHVPSSEVGNVNATLQTWSGTSRRGTEALQRRAFVRGRADR